jgi:hypothetical protein
VTHNAPVSRPSDPGGGVGKRLRQDLDRQGLAVRALARQLAGEGSTREEIEHWRRYVVRWLSLDGGRGMSPEYAQLMADTLGTEPDRYLSSQYDEGQQLERRIQRLQDQLQEARKDLAQQRKRRQSRA